uniref:Methyltransferase type 11 domain-containing protein n=1 Tax=Entomoneis paludosa TaxID=265537 RepID=A0A7S2Y979_9STRA|mmetsp:Transcript_23434/g.48645  ORF Transcript_23434/g.48645 Transcript_23434/m.48645 type:complete len:408 (+) Transcript_23434:143-1366(+)|eukprot:CAMPEP_0172468902 /NCGR_PEP_ID=MMETSP1065-20121228/62381_1 /TAXON_ID=265537 /ORGANISM="Amphiprora paludosa, Strain CCMP125" /LENGTH=407 /DNA_ID=CAMNT_0013226395 /DNA_START=119 /DNA_END=1342 /DNA_ORIENTATION=+
MKNLSILSLLLLAEQGCGFVAQPTIQTATALLSTAATSEGKDAAATVIDEPNEADLERARQKKILLGILKPEPTKDPVLADPVTKQPIIVNPKTGTYFGSFNGRAARRTKYEMQASGSSDRYEGSSRTFFNLLEPVKEEEITNEDRTTTARDALLRNLTPLIPPPLRSALATAGVAVGENYVPMRDLFTSPAVSYAYERGWRDNFRAAGFPGEDEEARMAMEYFAPSMSRNMDTRVLVDMSCATGLFTRRFAKSGNYKRVLGCDYSASMLEEARRRIQADSSLSNLPETQLDLVRLDVGQIPMQDSSIDALHAGAAMHCWPDLPAAAEEIHRVLKPGGRYFATTFLSSYFGMLQASEGGATGPSRQAFQYFESVDQLRELMIMGGFARDKVNVEVIEPACVVIRCEK